MGLLKHLLFWPVTGPKFLFDFSMDKVQGVVRDELTDDSSIKAELLELQLKLELGDIDDDEYVRREAEVMQKLRDVREWREHFGLGVSGGPVRVAPQPEEPAPRAAGPEPARPEASGPTPEPPAPELDEPGGPNIASPTDVTIELNFDDWHQ